MAVNHDLVAPCGLYCAACPMYMAAHNDDVAEKLAARLQKSVENVKCDGCRPTKGEPTPLHGRKCSTFLCAELKGCNFCHECDEFPCERLAPAADRADSLPHNAKIFNLLSIKRDGIESWVEHYPAIMMRYFKGKMEIGQGPCSPKDE